MLQLIQYEPGQELHLISVSTFSSYVDGGVLHQESDSPPPSLS